jgi:LAO/AO transport system kinase
VPLEDLKTGGKRAIARALSRLDRPNLTAEDATLLDEAFAKPLGMVIGLTGPPGVGKSTLTQALIERLRATEKSVAVIAVDPSSQKTGGALLGDRTRLSLDPEDAKLFVRSLAARTGLGAFPTTPSPQRCCCALCSTWCWWKRSVSVSRTPMWR